MRSSWFLSDQTGYNEPLCSDITDWAQSPAETTACIYVYTVQHMPVCPDLEKLHFELYGKLHMPNIPVSLDGFYPDLYEVVICQLDC